MVVIGLWPGRGYHVWRDKVIWQHPFCSGGPSAFVALVMLVRVEPFWHRSGGLLGSHRGGGSAKRATMNRSPSHDPLFYLFLVADHYCLADIAACVALLQRSLSCASDDRLPSRLHRVARSHSLALLALCIGLAWYCALVRRRRHGSSTTPTCMCPGLCVVGQTLEACGGALCRGCAAHHLERAIHHPSQSSATRPPHIIYPSGVVVQPSLFPALRYDHRGSVLSVRRSHRAQVAGRYYGGLLANEFAQLAGDSDALLRWDNKTPFVRLQSNAR